MIHLEPKERATVEAILKARVPNREVLVFGSRVTGGRKPFSDIDLCVMGDEPVPLSVTADLREAFTESDLPFRVDILDWATTSEAFRAIIRRDGERLI